MTKELIRKEYLKGNSKRYTETKNYDIYDYIEENIILDITHKEKVYCYINDIMPKCKCCNNIPYFVNFSSGFKQFCSVSCSVVFNKNNQEYTRKESIQEKTADMTKYDIVYKLYHKSLKIQKWRDIEALKEYYNFYSLAQLYNHLILKENQICYICNIPFNIDKNTGSARSCKCINKYEQALNKTDNFDNKKFLDYIIKNNLYYYSDTINSKIKEVYFKRFYKKYENFMEQLHNDCKENNIKFYGYYSSTSKQEQEILAYIKTIYNGKIVSNDRHLGFELDIFLPDINVAIEYNGNYWHSIEFKNELYHINKTNTCEDNNIRLLMIFESEYLFDKGSIKALISSFISNRIVYNGNKWDRRFYSTLNCDFKYNVSNPVYDENLNTFNSGFINKLKA